jgi:hypothetical protein
MRTLPFLLPAICAVDLPVTVFAQARVVGVIGAPPPDSAQMAAMMANSMRMAKPAVFALDHKTDLDLTFEMIYANNPRTSSSS